MSHPPSAEEARAALPLFLAVTTRAADWQRAMRVLEEFIDFHEGCAEREATLVLTIEEQQRDLDDAAEPDGHHF